jgi:Putative Fe-S cluster
MAAEVDRVLEQLPGFDCLRCGGTCLELAERIVAGDAATDDCDAAWDETLELVINGEAVPLTEFPREFLLRTVLGSASALKGVGKVRTLQLRIVDRSDG